MLSDLIKCCSFGLVAAAPLTALAAGVLLAHPEKTAHTETDTIKE